MTHFVQVSSPPPSQDRATLWAGADDSLFLIFADGAGGCSGAARAAELLCSAGSRAVDALGLQERLDPESYYQILRRLDQHLREDRDAGLCTGILLGAAGERLCGASVGDSQIWLRQDGRWIELSFAQQRKPLLGSAQAVITSFGPMLARGRLLVASDGLFDALPADRWQPLAERDDLEQAAEALLEAARSWSGQFADDLTLIIADLDPPGPVEGS